MKKYYIYITTEERNLIVESLVAKKNSLIAAGKYADGVDEVLLKIMRVKLKKVRVIYT
ncbi:MAG: hypothetical protein ACI4IS_05185 [Acutalibacteraceae bacterium]